MYFQCRVVGSSSRYEKGDLRLVPFLQRGLIEYCAVVEWFFGREVSTSIDPATCHRARARRPSSRARAAPALERRGAGPPRAP